MLYGPLKPLKLFEAYSEGFSGDIEEESAVADGP